MLETRPGGEVRVFAQYKGDVSEQADVVVVGSGPCGAVVARELAHSGASVLLLEEGPPFTPQDFELNGSLSMARTMREGGLRFTTGGQHLPTMQAIALGGGSLVNSAICVRPPSWVFDGWCGDFELEHTSRTDLDPHFDAVEKFLGIAPTPENVQGARNLLLKRACDALGYSSEPIARNVTGCRGSGECYTGCRNRAKQSMDLTYIPDAIRAGARVLTSVQVQRVLAEGSRVTGVVGQVVQPFTGRRSYRVHVRAKVVVLAAGVMATPVILQKSGDLANRSGQVGENLQFHPGVAVAAFFPEPTDPQFGATQGYHTLQFLKEGFKIETLWAPPPLLAARLPGYGRALKRRIAELSHCAVWDAIVSCHRSTGRVRARCFGMQPRLTYRIHPEDTVLLRRALWVLTELFFAAGARTILPPVFGAPEELHSLADAEVLRRAWRARDFAMASTHAFCSTRMHSDPRRGVVDEFGRCHDLENLYIVDTGIFPRSPSVNPMLTGMALAHRSAGFIAERL